MSNLKLIALAAALFVLPPAKSLWAEHAIRVDEMVVVLIDAVDVPATQSGVIAEIPVREGDAVAVGDDLAKLDDREAQLQQAMAQTQLDIAVEKAESDLATDLARKKLAQQQQIARQHKFTRDVADLKAENEVRILATKKAQGVAKNELDRALLARREFADSVSQSEIDGLTLAHEKSKLETQQALFERELDVLYAKAELEAAAGLQLGIERSKIEVAQAVAEHKIQRLQVALQRQQSELADLGKQKHRILSPLHGVVVERFKNRGDWVNVGDPVVRVIRLNRLRAEGFVPSDAIGALRAAGSVQLTIATGVNSSVDREGKVVFISPEIDPVNNEVRFWVEFDNPQLDVLPGMRLSLRSKP